MIRFHAFGVPFRLHILAILASGLAIVLGGGKDLVCTLIATGIHEMAHLFAARLCRLKIEYVDLMPFGGAAKVRNLYAVPAGRLILTALAGPAANALGALLAPALVWTGIIGYSAAVKMFKIHLILMLFNLMPALPLDGGRVFYALTRGVLGSGKAVRCCVTQSFLLSGFLAALSVIGYIRFRQFNLALPILSVFLVAVSLREREGAEADAASQTVERLCAPDRLPARAKIIAMDSADTRDALSYLKTGDSHLFALVRKGVVEELVTESEMARRILSPGE